MIDARLLLKFIQKNSVSRFLFILLSVTLFPAADLWLFVYLASLIPAYFNLLLASAFAFSLICFFIVFFIIRSELDEIKHTIKKGIYPENRFNRLAGSFLTAWLLMTPGFITAVIGIFLLIPSLKTALGRVLTKRLQKDIKAVYEYIKLYEIEI